VIDFVAGFLSAWILRSLSQRRPSRRGGNIGATPLVRNEGRTTAQRIYRGAMWREKGSDTRHPLGNEPDAAEFARHIVKVQGLNWPATLGDFTLVGPADNQGACRWYERRHHDGTIERIKVDHQLQPLKPMSTDPSITPPPELLAKLWREASAGRDDAPIGEIFNHGVYLAYRAGADQELEACCEWVSQWRCMVGGNRPEVGLRAARRPKPPSLKELALALLDKAEDPSWDINDFSIVRQALEALPND